MPAKMRAVLAKLVGGWGDDYHDYAGHREVGGVPELGKSWLRNMCTLPNIYIWTSNLCEAFSCKKQKVSFIKQHLSKISILLFRATKGEASTHWSVWFDADIHLNMNMYTCLYIFISVLFIMIYPNAQEIPCDFPEFVIQFLSLSILLSNYISHNTW